MFLIKIYKYSVVSLYRDLQMGTQINIKTWRFKGQAKKCFITKEEQRFVSAFNVPN